ncbi:serine carboxypeptidase-like 20 [Humulus lupulus]|uniref:serine carboxypeptidase-like 20 n=1 Tax=Humulus lupulus TaxID=3486 RepID=UPI002B4178F1|nr:serine carboxypeptidase-like 20 [Humulus lupulus]
MDYKLFFIILSIALGLAAMQTKAAPKDALITSLPGFNGTFQSKHYSGYVTLKGKPHHQYLFYYFVESERNPSKDPVVLWLNGGPGCSSMDGFVYEHGPFNFKAGKTHGTLPTLHINPYSWSKVSNIIYLDSPAGVGFSYSKSTNLYETGDLEAASYTHKFLLKWFKKFPEFISNPFYIAGESYAGVYVPTLAAEIVTGNGSNGTSPIINLKGYMVGNGVTDQSFDDNALVPFAHGMGLISEEIFEEVDAACGADYHNHPSEHCSKMLNKVFDSLVGLNVYDILEPCFHNSNGEEDLNKNKSLPSSFKQLGKTDKPLPVRKRMFGRAWPFQAPVRDGTLPSWPELITNVEVECINDRVASAWLNDEKVRKAIHAGAESEIGEWELCCDDLSYDHDAGSMIPYHKNLTSLGFRVLIFSGDHDMCVPYTGSQAWTRSLGYKTVDEWRPWSSSIDQVAGYVQGYDNNLTFVTIKGAGHTVPEYKPRESLDFYSRWLEGRPI